MSQYISAHLSNSYLPPFGNNEGQMAPKVKKMMRDRPWEPDSFFDWQLINKVCDLLENENHHEVFIESSPPNMMRVPAMLDVFKNCRYVFSISSPYSYIGSCLFNYFAKQVKSKKDYDKLNLNLGFRIERITRKWVRKAMIQKNNIELYGKNGAITTYEDFCSNPTRLLDLVGVEYSRDQSQTQLIKGKKNTKMNQIVNMLPKHLAFLGEEF